MMRPIVIWMPVPPRRFREETATPMTESMNVAKGVAVREYFSTRLLLISLTPCSFCCSI